VFSTSIHISINKYCLPPKTQIIIYLWFFFHCTVLNFLTYSLKKNKQEKEIMIEAEHSLNWMWWMEYMKLWKKAAATPCIVDLSEPLLEWARERNKTHRQENLFWEQSLHTLTFFPILCSINLLLAFTLFTYVTNQPLLFFPLPLKSITFYQK